MILHSILRSFVISTPYLVFRPLRGPFSIRCKSAPFLSLYAGFVSKGRHQLRRRASSFAISAAKWGELKWNACVPGVDWPEFCTSIKASRYLCSWRKKYRSMKSGMLLALLVASLRCLGGTSLFFLDTRILAILRAVEFHAKTTPFRSRGSFSSSV